MQLIKQSTASSLLVGPVLDASGVAVTTAVLANFTLTKNGTSAVLTGASVTHDHNGNYKIDLTTGNADTLGRLTLTVNNSAMAMSSHRYSVLPAVAFDVLITDGNLASRTNITAGTIATVTTLTNLPSIPANWLTATGIAADAITDAKVAADVTIASVTGSVGSVTGLTASDVGAIKSKTDTLPASPASTTNITAGTITTVTNLTNAPTAGDLTATMKTSVTTAATAATPIAASVTGSVGSVASFGTLVADVATAVWAAGTRTITAISDSAGITTLLSRIVGTLASGTHTAQTGDSFARLGVPAGASIAADVATRSSHSASDVWAVGTRTITGGTIATVSDKTGYSLSQTFPTNFAALGINVSGHISRVTLTDTTTTNTDMRGTNSAMLAASYTAPANSDIAAIKTKTDQFAFTVANRVDANALSGSGLDAAGVRSAIGLASANMDTQLSTISSKTGNLPSDPADQSAIEAAITAATSGLATAALLATVAGYLDTEIAAILEDTGTTLPAQIAALNNTSAAQVVTAMGTGTFLTAVPWNAAWDAEVQSECADAIAAYDPPTSAELDARTLVAASYATPTNITAGTIATVTTLTNLPSIPTGWLTATGIAADAITDAKVAADVTIASVTGSVGSVASFGTLVADVATAVWAAGTRTITAISDSSGITTLLTRIVGTLASGTHTAQTGDAFARLGVPAGASIAADVATRLATSGYTTPPTTAAIAAAVDVALINTGDGADLLQAIANQIAGDWVAGDASPLAVVAALTANATFITLVADAAAAKVAAQAVDTKIVGTIASGTHTAQTGDSFARLGVPAGASIAADVATRSSHSASDVWAVGTRTITGGTIATVSDKTGYSLSQTFPTNFAALGINVSGHISRVTLTDTTTTNTDMRGTDSAMLAASYAAPANSDIAAIKTKTDNLPSDPADQSAVEAAIANLQNHGDNSWVTVSSDTQSNTGIRRGTEEFTPVLFTFPVASLVNAGFTKSKRLDGGSSTSVVGAITFLYTLNGNHWYRLAYDDTDRPASNTAGIVQYLFVAGGNSVSIELLVSDTDSNPVMGVAY